MQKFDLFKTFDALNKDHRHFLQRDDICTPMSCVMTMLNYLPVELWARPTLQVLDPCCGNGNFIAGLLQKTTFEHITGFDINDLRLANCMQLLHFQAQHQDFLTFNEQKFDLIAANPPYRGNGNKNRGISHQFILHSLDLLNDHGYLCFITPSNWMSYNTNNVVLKRLLNEGSFLVLDFSAKKAFPGVGSSFVIWVWQKTTVHFQTKVKNTYLITDEQTVLLPKNIPCLPLYLNDSTLKLMQIGLQQMLNDVKYRCDLHDFTQKVKLSHIQTPPFIFPTIHTTKQMRYAKIQQDIYEKYLIILPLSNYLVPFVAHHCNVTQSVAYIAYSTLQTAETALKQWKNKNVQLLIHLTRHGNFNNLQVLRHLNLPALINYTDSDLTQLYERISKYYAKNE